MSHKKKSDESKTGNIGAIDKSKEGGGGTVGGAPSEKPETGNVGRRIVGQGKRRETLKKWSKDST